MPQGFQVVIEAFALCVNSLGLQLFQHLGKTQSMLIVGLFQQHPKQIQQFHFLLRNIGHWISPPFTGLPPQN